MMRLGPLEAVHRPVAHPKGPPVLLIHGIGLGPWFWERDQGILADEFGLESWAVALPGHGSDGEPRLQECADRVEAAARALGQPALVGHSAGGLVAQMVATRLSPPALALVAAVPPRPVPWIPTRVGVRTILPHLGELGTGRGLAMSMDDYVRTGMHLLPEGQREAVFRRIIPWPAPLVRDLAFRRPEIRREEIACPVLVTHGFKDAALRLWVSRLLADHYDGLLWRFDDLAHLPPLEPGGERHARSLGEWLLRPRRRKVVEVDPLAPAEGVGQAEREARRPRQERSNSRFGSRLKGGGPSSG